MNLSKKDIIEYKSTLDSCRKNEIEMKVIDDDFERDALEGWSENQVSINQIKSIDIKIKMKSRIKIILSGVIITLISIIAISILLNPNESKETKSIQRNETKKLINSTISKDSISTFSELPKKLQINPSKIKSDFEEKQLFQVGEISDQNEINRDPIHLPIKNPSKINSSIPKRENLAKETFLNDLKVIDYRFYRSRPYEAIKNELGGTPANKETNEGESSEIVTNIENTYFSYLDKSLNYFIKNKFKTALNRFEVILDTYPDDVNALFYSAICLYNLHQFELCEKRLLQLKNSRFTNFDQEQEWYLLLVFKNNQKKESFDNQRQLIIKNKGFYAKQAGNIMFE